MSKAWSFAQHLMSQIELLKALFRPCPANPTIVELKYQGLLDWDHARIVMLFHSGVYHVRLLY